jgi:hypothetical protein
MHVPESQVTLALYTVPELHRDLGSVTLQTHVVKALSMQGGELLTAAGYRQDGQEEVFNLTTEEQRARRFSAFFQRIIVEGEPLEYDCNGLAAYVIGTEDDIRRGAHFTNQHVTGAPHPHHELQAGHAYGIVSGASRRSRGSVSHVLLGVDSPWHNVSALGRGGPNHQYGKLAVTSTVHLKRLYRGTYIAPYFLRVN